MNMKKEVKKVPITIKWEVPLDFEASYANFAAVQIQDGLVVLNLGVVIPPLSGSDPDKQMEALKKIGHIPVKTVSRVVLTPSKARMIIEALTKTLEDNFEIEDELQEGQ